MRHGRRPVAQLVAVARAVDGRRPGHPAGQRLRPEPGKVAGGDAYFYYNGAKLLVERARLHQPLPVHPPRTHHRSCSPPTSPRSSSSCWPSLQAVGLKTFLAARVWCCILGTAAIAVCGYTGREIAGRRVGLIAAFLLAVYPNIWMSDELALSEALAPLLVATLLLCRLPVLEGPGRQAGDLARRGHRHRHAGAGRAHACSSSSSSSRSSSWPGRSAGGGASPSSGSRSWPPRSSSRPGSATT